MNTDQKLQEQREFVALLGIDKPHPEYNETGTLDHHPGYHVLRCIRCGEPYIVGVAELHRMCGGPGCQA